jgi:hypothetical protein
MVPSPQPPPPEPAPKLRRVVAAILDYLFDATPALLMFALASGSRRMEFSFAALAFARPAGGSGKPVKPAKLARPPRGPRRPLGTPPKGT